MFEWAYLFFLGDDIGRLPGIGCGHACEKMTTLTPTWLHSHQHVPEGPAAPRVEVTAPVRGVWALTADSGTGPG